MSVLQKILGSQDLSGQESIATIESEPQNPFTEVQVLQGHTDIVRKLRQIDERRCISAGDDNTAIVWDIKSGQKIHQLCGHTRRIIEIVLLTPPDEQAAEITLLTASADKSIKQWDLNTGDCLKTITDKASVFRCLLVFDAGHYVCAAGNNVCIWDQDGTSVARLERPCSEEDIQFLICIEDLKLVAGVDKQLFVYILEHFSPNTFGTSSKISLLRKLPPHREAISCLVNVSEALFASGSLDGTIILWCIDSLTPSRYFNSIPEYAGVEHMYPYSVQHMISVDDRYLCVAIGSGFSIYDVFVGKSIIEKPHAHYSKILHIGFVWDNTLLATCSEDGSVRLWGRNEVAADFCHRACPTEVQSIMGRFTGLGTEVLRTWRGEDLLHVELIGECLGHSGGIQMFVDFGFSGMVTCGVDALVLAWKNSEMQSLWRTELLQELMAGAVGVV